MLKELHISNYRLFDDLTIPDLGQVNLIAGKNNTGKTALLEALRILAARGNNTVVNHVLKTRGEFIEANFKSYDNLFPKGNLVTSGETELQVNRLKVFRKLQSNKIFYSTISFGSEKGNLNPNITADHPQDQSIYVPFNQLDFPLQDLWDKIALTPLEKDLLEILRIIEPRLHRIDVKEENSRVLLEGDIGPVSLKSLGEGMSRMLWLAVL